VVDVRLHAGHIVSAVGSNSGHSFHSCVVTLMLVEGVNHLIYDWIHTSADETWLEADSAVVVVDAVACEGDVLEAQHVLSGVHIDNAERDSHATKHPCRRNYCAQGCTRRVRNARDRLEWERDTCDAVAVVAVVGNRRSLVLEREEGSASCSKVGDCTGRCLLVLPLVSLPSPSS